LGVKERAKQLTSGGQRCSRMKIMKINGKKVFTKLINWGIITGT
jgi:hypothetical protein